ncbi:pantetheine-phosphate adenylyltransferase [Pediococcus argentinicus]|uniref:pantetheine-phosphate adenylyltransferase n=1 Tax=Pediococcus argentinicus TaxID=480391 RepID=UPI0033904AA1
MTIALYAGSFDPLTNGHLDVIKRSSNIFDQLIIAVGENTSKNSLFTPQERINFIEKATQDLPNVKVIGYQGLTVELFKQFDVNVLVRGLRNGTDFLYEQQIAEMNHFLDKEVETVFIPADPKWNKTSSSLLKEVIMMGGNVQGLAPEYVISAMESRLKK